MVTWDCHVSTFKTRGTTPEESNWVKIVNNKGASSVAHLTNNEDGVPVCPAAKLDESSCMASINFFFIYYNIS